MTNQQRIATGRIISDMIKADNIIEEREISEMKSLMMQYNITDEHMKCARGIRFSEAVNELTGVSGLTRKEREQLFNDIHKLSLSDKACVQKEALLLLALKYCLVDVDGYKVRGANGRLIKPKLVECPATESALTDPYIVYVESSYDQVRNEEISSQFKLMVATAKLYGINFIYIPELVKEFMSMRRQYITDVIRFMDPGLSEGFIQDIYDRLSSMTTASFFKEVLYDRLNVKVDADIPPSLLINIGTSVVPYCVTEGPVQYYTEYLCLPLYAETMQVVEDVLRTYCSCVSVQFTQVTNDNIGHFRYFGFYKALFDYLIAPPPVEPDIIFAGRNVRDNRHELIFRYGKSMEKKIQVTPQAYNLYLEIAMSGKGGASKNERVVISRLRSKITEVLTDVTYSAKYMPEKVCNRYKLLIDKSKLFERRYTDHQQKAYEDLPLRTKGGAIHS